MSLTSFPPARIGSCRSASPSGVVNSRDVVIESPDQIVDLVTPGDQQPADVDHHTMVGLQLLLSGPPSQDSALVHSAEPGRELWDYTPAIAKEQCRGLGQEQRRFGRWAVEYHF